MYKNTLRNRTCQTTAWPSPPKLSLGGNPQTGPLYIHVGEDLRGSIRPLELLDKSLSHHHDSSWLNMSHTSCDHTGSGLALGSEPGCGWTMCSRLPKTILDSTSEIGNSHQCPDHPSIHHMTFMWPCWSRDRVWGWNPSERVLSDSGRFLRVCDLCSTCSDPIGAHIGRLDGKPWHMK